MLHQGWYHAAQSLQCWVSYMLPEPACTLQTLLHVLLDCTDHAIAAMTMLLCDIVLDMCLLVAAVCV